MSIEHLTPEGDIATITPSQTELAVLACTVDEVYKEIEDLDQSTAFDQMAVAGAELRESMPELSDTLRAMASHVLYKAAVLVLPPPSEVSLPPTPQRYRTPAENQLLKAGVSRGLALGIAGLHGYGYKSQQPDNIINDVIAIKEMGGVLGASANAKDQLDLHSEDASYNLAGALMPNGTRLSDAFNASPDWLTLYFLRNPDGVPSFVSRPDVTRLSDNTLELLHQPRFMNLTNPGQGGNKNDSGLPVSVLYEGNASEPWIRANTSNLIVAEKDDIEAEEALEAFNQLVWNSTMDLPTSPGRVVLIDNRRVLHGRRSYTPDQAPRWDGQDRWQQRVVAADDASRLDPFLASPRIINPQKLLESIATN